MRILLAGDSWGIGVFEGAGEAYGPTGQGIHTILTELGHNVTNISKAGGSNWLMIDRIDNKWYDTGTCIFGWNDLKINFDLDQIDYIIFLQTDIFRERHYYGKQNLLDSDTKWKILEESFVEHLLTYSSLEEMINKYFEKFYSKLNSFNKKVICVGGWSQLHPSISQFDNLIPAVVSATKLLIPELTEDCYISDPEWFLQLSDNTKFVDKFNLEFKQMAIANATKMNLIYSNWHEVHPDLAGYKLLVEKIQKHLL